MKASTYICMLTGLIFNYTFADILNSKPAVIEDVKVCLDEYCNKEATCLIDWRNYYIQAKIKVNNETSNNPFCVKFILGSLSSEEFVNESGIKTAFLTFNKVSDTGSVSVELYGSQCTTLYHISGSTFLPALEDKELTIKDIDLDKTDIYIDEKLRFSAEVKNIQYNRDYELNYKCKIYIYDKNQKLLSEHSLSSYECSKLLNGSFISKSLKDLGITSSGTYYLQLKVEGFFKQNKVLVNGRTIELSNLDEWCKNILTTTSKKIKFSVKKRLIPKLVVDNLENGEYNFGKVEVGKKVSKTIVIKNIGKDEASIKEIKWIYNPNNAFVIEKNTCNSIIPATGTCSLTVEFKPQKETSYQGELVIRYNENYSLDINFYGTGYKPVSNIEIIPSHIEFNNVFVNETSKKAVTIKGDREFIIKNFQLYSDYFPPSGFGKFKIDKGTCEIGKPLKECTFYVEFTPFYEASFSDEINIYFENTSKPVYTVKIDASSKCKEYPHFEIKAENTINFGKVYIGESSKYTLNLKIQGDVESGLESVEINPDVFEIIKSTCFSPENPSSNYNCTIELKFTPKEKKTYVGKLKLNFYYYDWCKNVGVVEPYEITLLGEGEENPQNEEKNKILLSLIYEDGVVVDKLGKEDVLILYPSEIKNKPILKLRLKNTDCRNYVLKVYKIWESDEYCESLMENKPSEPEYIAEDVSQTFFNIDSNECFYEIKLTNDIEAGLYSVILSNKAKSESIELVRFNIYLDPVKLFGTNLVNNLPYLNLGIDSVSSSLPSGSDVLVGDLSNLGLIKIAEHFYGNLCLLRYLESDYKSDLSACFIGGAIGAVIGFFVSGIGAVPGAARGCEIGSFVYNTASFLHSNIASFLHRSPNDSEGLYYYLLSEQDMLTLCSDDLQVSFSNFTSPFVEIDVAECIKKLSKSLNTKIYVYENPIKVVSTDENVCEVNQYFYDTETDTNSEILKIRIPLNNNIQVLSTDIPVFKYFLIASEKPLIKVIHNSKAKIDVGYYELITKKYAYLNSALLNTNLKVLPNFYYALMLYRACKELNNVCSIDYIYVPFKGFYPFDKIINSFAKNNKLHGNDSVSTNVTSIFLNHAYTMPVIVKYTGILVDDLVDRILGEQKEKVINKIKTISQNETILDIKVVDPYMYIYTLTSDEKKIYLLNLYTTSIDYEFFYRKDNSLEHAYLNTIYGQKVDITDKVCQKNSTDTFSQMLQRFCTFTLESFQKKATVTEYNYEVNKGFLRVVRVKKLQKIIPSISDVKTFRLLTRIVVNTSEVRGIYKNLGFKEKKLASDFESYLTNIINNIAKQYNKNLSPDQIDKILEQIKTFTKEKIYSTKEGNIIKINLMINNLNPSKMRELLINFGFDNISAIKFINELYKNISHIEIHVVEAIKLKNLEKEVKSLGNALSNLATDKTTVHTMFENWKGLERAFKNVEEKLDKLIELGIKNKKIIKIDGVTIKNGDVKKALYSLLNGGSFQSLELEIKLKKPITAYFIKKGQSGKLIINKYQTSKVIVGISIIDRGKIEIKTLYPAEP